MVHHKYPSSTLGGRSPIEVLAVAVLTVVVLGGGRQAIADPPVRSEVDWADSSLSGAELNTVDSSVGVVPYLTFSRQIVNDPENRLWHVHTWWWQGHQWEKLEVVQGLLHNPHPTAASRESAVATDLVHAWIIGLPGDNEIAWQAMDPALGTMVGQELKFLANHGGYPVGLAVRQDDTPVFTFWRGAGMQVGPWNGDEQDPDERLMAKCDNAHAPVQLDTGDRHFAVCRSTPAGGVEKDIWLYYEDANGLQQSVQVFGVADAHEWLFPDLVMVGDDAVVAAYNATLEQVHVRWQVNGQFVPGSVVLLDVGQPLSELAVAARQAPDGIEMAVVAREAAALHYAERDALGVVSASRRVDLAKADGAVCLKTLELKVDVHLPNAQDAWVSWQARMGEVAAMEFTRFDRGDGRSLPYALSYRDKHSTALARGLDGTHWTCFIEQVAPGRLDVFVRRRSDPRLLVEANVGAGTDPYARRCDLDVDGNGDLHVVWANHTADRLRYRKYSGAWGAVVDVTDSVGAVPATDHVALAVERGPGLDGITMAFNRPADGLMKPCVLESVDMAAQHSVACFNADAPSMYPSLTNYGPVGKRYAVAYGTDNPPEVRVALRSNLGLWVSEVVAAERGYDFAVAARPIPGLTNAGRAFVAWYAPGSASVKLAERAGPGLWDPPQVLDNVAGELLDMRLPPTQECEPVLTYRRSNGAQPPALAMVSWSRFGGGRAPGAAAPTPIRTLCELQANSQGTALELDDSGNPRVGHRNVTTDKTLYYESRP